MTSSQDFLAGGGEMGERIRAFDWSATPLGPIAGWPQSLRSAMSILLPSKAQISLFWGPELVTLYNDAYRPVFGAKHPGALGQPIRAAWEELWRAGLKELFDGVLRTGEAFWAQDLPFFMERHGYLEETYFDVSYDPVRDESGRVGGVFCIVSEKTGRVIGERRLRTLRDLGRIAAGAQSTTAVFRAVAGVLAENPQDLPFALLYAPDGNEGATLVAATGIAGPAASEHLPDAHAPWPLVREQAIVSGAQLAAAGPLHAGPWPEAIRAVFVLPLPGSGETGHGWLVCGASPRRQVDERCRDFMSMVAASIASALDSARRSEHEHRRAEMLAELDRAKTAFFSNVSHEFRTPLTLLMGPLDDALDDAAHPLPAVQRERLDMARRGSARLHKLVNTLLDFTRIEAGRAQARYVETDVGALTAELASSFRSAVERAGLRFVVDVAPSNAWVDRDFWEKIVFNLLSNAFKFTHEGEIGVQVRERGGAIELAVRDTGVGIPAAEQPRVFERFHRVEGVRSRTHEGSGIGLALVQELVRLHGGEVTVTSREGEGSCFTVTVPCGQEHLDPLRVGAAAQLAGTAVGATAYVDEALRWLPTPAAPAPATATAARPRIVLADDNADMREYIRNLLAGSYEVEALRDGEEVLQAVQACGADLVISDVMMPRLDGLALVRRLRQQPATATLPVMLLSARAGEGARIEGIDAGADDYLEKPFAARELLARVAARLEISQLRRAAAREAQLREQQLRLVTDNAPVLLLQFDAQGRYLFVNEPYAARVGWRAGDLVGRTVGEVLGAQAYARLQEYIGAALAGERVEFDALVPYPPLGERWMHGVYIPQHGADGAANGFVAVLQDVTERKEAELRLQEQAQRFEKLNEVGLSLAAESDLQRVVQVVTDVATHLSGAEFGAFFYNVTDAAGESYMLYTLSGVPRERFAGFGMPRNTAVFGPTFAGAGIVRVDDITRDPRYGRNPPHRGMPEGHLPVRSYLAVPVLSRSGEVLGGLFFGHSRVGVFSEEAERIVAGIAAQAAVAIDNARLHEQRLRLIGELQESDRRKDEFIATLSHELRNPLAPLRNGLHLLQLKTPQADDRVLEMMTRQVNQLVRLVDDLLEIARINRGTLALRKERIDLKAVVQHAVETSEPLVREFGHALEVALPERALWLQGDAARLAQVLSNLLNNASRYTDRGGRIALSVRVGAGRVLLSVRDSGIGFSAERARQLFQMFSRGERSQGLGIGLALSRRLAEMHGGTLEAASAGPGQGATFTVSLPLGEPTDAPAPAPAQPAGLPVLRVLVVDDNQDAADTLRMLLDLLGAEARVAHDGERGLALFEQFAPEAVLLDIGMPGMDGYQVARTLRARHPRWRGALIALTGWGQEEDRRKGQEAGFDHHLVKPVDVDALQALLASVAAARTTAAAK